MKNLGLTKNLLYGSLLGLLLSAVILFILNNILAPDYLYLRDEMKQTYEGGALTFIAIYFVAVGFLKPQEISDLSLGMGILLIFGFAIAGYLIPIFVLGVFALILSITTPTLEFYNLLFEAVGPFCLGGISVGFVAGAYHYKNPLK